MFGTWHFFTLHNNTIVKPKSSYYEKMIVKCPSIKTSEHDTFLKEQGFCFITERGCVCLAMFENLAFRRRDP